MTDAVVIGSGPNGLAAAIRLAEHGRSVLVLEAADRPGGAVRTQELTLPGFRHDTFSAVHPAGVASPVFARMPLRDHGLEWVHPAACVAHTLTPGSSAVLYRDTAATAASLDDLHPGDGERWVSFVQPFLDAFEGGLPSASYLGVLADAAEAADAPADYLAALRSRPCRSNFGG